MPAGSEKDYAEMIRIRAEDARVQNNINTNRNREGEATASHLTSITLLTYNSHTILTTRTQTAQTATKLKSWTPLPPQPH